MDGQIKRTVVESKEPAWLANLPEPEVRIENSQIRLTRPWLQDLIDVLKGGRSAADKKGKKLPLTEAQRAERRRRALEMEIERRKALRAAQRRARLARKLAQDGSADQVNNPFSSSFYSIF